MDVQTSITLPERAKIGIGESEMFVMQFRRKIVVTLTLAVANCSGTLLENKDAEPKRSKELSASRSCLKMVGGTEKDDYPATFIIVSPMAKIANGYEFCAATWIAHNWAITATHCITDSNLTLPKTYMLLPRRLPTATDAGLALKTKVQALRVVRPNIYSTGDDPKTAGSDPQTFNPDNPDHINQDLAFLEFPAGTGKNILPMNDSTKPAAGTSVTIVGFGVRSLADAKKDIFTVGGMIPQNMSHNIAAFPSNIDPSLYQNMLYLSSPTGAGLPLPGDSGGPMLASGKIVGVSAVFFVSPNQAPSAMYSGLTGTKSKAIIAAALAAGMKPGDMGAPILKVTGAQGTIPDVETLNSLSPATGDSQRRLGSPAGVLEQEAGSVSDSSQAQDCVGTDE